MPDQEKRSGIFEATSPKMMVYDPHLTEAAYFEDPKTGKKSKDKSYSANFLLDPADPDLAVMRRLALGLAKDAFPVEYNAAFSRLPKDVGDPVVEMIALLSPALNFPFKSGTAMADARRAKDPDKNDGEFLRGKIFFSTGTGEGYPPALGGIENGLPMHYRSADQIAKASSKFYFGAEAFFGVNFKVYVVGSNKPGVKAYLSQVFVTGKGERMGGTVNPAETFGRYFGKVSSVNPMEDDFRVVLASL